MKSKIFSLLLVMSLVASVGVAQTDSSSDSPRELTEEQIENLDIAVSDVSIEKKQGFLSSFLSILTGEGVVGPGDTVTFEAYLEIGDIEEICADGDYTDDYVMDSWVQGQNGLLSETEKDIIVSCGGGNAPIQRDFTVPNQEGFFEYDFAVGTLTDLDLGGDTYTRVLETDSVEVTAKDLTAEIDVSDSTPEVGQEVTIAGDQSDGYGGIDIYEWSIDGQSVGGDNQVINYAFSEAGTQKIELRVSDYAWQDMYLGERRWETTTMTVDVQESSSDGSTDDGTSDSDSTDDSGSDDTDSSNNNLEPEIKSISVYSDKGETVVTDSFTEGSTLTVNTFAVDPEGQKLQVETVYNSRQYVGNKVNITAKEAGNKTLSVTVSDGENTVTKNKQISIVPLNTEEESEEDDSVERTVHVHDSSENECTEFETTESDLPIDTYDNKEDCQDDNFSALEKIWYGFIDFLGGLSGGGSN